MGNQFLIIDGIINETVFKKENIRLLWVLKEANDTKSTEGWDMRKFLSNRKEGLFTYAKWRSTFGLICKISYAVLDNKRTYSEINNYDDEMLTRVLDRIAYINVKKTSGGSSVDYNVFNEYLKNPKHIRGVKQQINDIRPHIVICGNTFQYLFPDILFDFDREWLYQESQIKYVNGWHPNARINHEKYFNDIKLALADN